jgi:hypothetical protein
VYCLHPESFFRSSRSSSGKHTKMGMAPLSTGLIDNDPGIGATRGRREKRKLPSKGPQELGKVEDDSRESSTQTMDDVAPTSVFGLCAPPYSSDDLSGSRARKVA